MCPRQWKWCLDRQQLYKHRYLGVFVSVNGSGVWTDHGYKHRYLGVFVSESSVWTDHGYKLRYLGVFFSVSENGVSLDRQQLIFSLPLGCPTMSLAKRFLSACRMLYNFLPESSFSEMFMCNNISGVQLSHDLQLHLSLFCMLPLTRGCWCLWSICCKCTWTNLFDSFWNMWPVIFFVVLDSTSELCVQFSLFLWTLTQLTTAVTATFYHQFTACHLFCSAGFNKWTLCTVQFVFMDSDSTDHCCDSDFLSSVYSFSCFYLTEPWTSTLFKLQGVQPFTTRTHSCSGSTPELHFQTMLVYQTTQHDALPWSQRREEGWGKAESKVSPQQDQSTGSL